jgi:hypothetical protein
MEKDDKKYEVISAKKAEVIAVSEEMKEVVNIVSAKVEESMRLCASLARQFALK